MALANYEDVLAQLRSAGLVVESLDFGRLRRCHVEGDREKRGWYILHELQLDSGDTIIVGSYGVWQGNERNAQKIELPKSGVSRDQADALRKRNGRRQAARRAGAPRRRRARSKGRATRVGSLQRGWRLRLPRQKRRCWLRCEVFGARRARDPGAGHGRHHPWAAGNPRQPQRWCKRTGKAVLALWRRHQGPFFAIGTPAAGGVILAG